MAEIRQHYLTQMHEVRDHYDQQRNLILEFSVGPAAKSEDKAHSSTNTVVKMENGSASPLATAEEEEIYRYNDSMKSEIQKLTSLRNLHEAFLSPETTVGCDVPGTSTGRCSLPPSFDLPTDSVSNGKIRLPEGDSDENTSMLHNSKSVC